MSKQRLIDANDLKEKAHMIEIFDKQWVVDEIEIDNAPTVDAVPVVHGEWIKPVDEYGDRLRYECSKCGGHPLLAGDESDELSKYCPYCGAKMDGDKHE